MCFFSFVECLFLVIVFEGLVLLSWGKFLEFGGFEILVFSVEFFVLEIIGFDIVFVSLYCWGCWSFFIYLDDIGILLGLIFFLVIFFLFNFGRILFFWYFFFFVVVLNSCFFLGWEGDFISVIIFVFFSFDGENVGDIIFDSML